MALGFSHPVVFDLPKGIAAKVDKNLVILSSASTAKCWSETASKIRAIRPPEPYKGKGIKYRRRNDQAEGREDRRSVSPA